MVSVDIRRGKCKAKPKKTIYAFKGYTHPLSNHFPCSLKLYGKDFKSVEHVLYWRMALELGNDELAKEIHKARHAGEAKRIGKNIADEETRWNWEEKNVDFMNNLLEAKAEQCPEFRQCLIENATKILAEANPCKFWATGMSTYLTEHTDPDFWPGRNQLGTLLMNLATHLCKNSSDNMQPWDNSQSISSSVQVIPDTQDNTNHTDQRFGNESDDQPENKPKKEVLPSNSLGTPQKDVVEDENEEYQDVVETENENEDQPNSLTPSLTNPKSKSLSHNLPKHKAKNPVEHTTKDAKADSTHQNSQRRSQPIHPRPHSHSVHELHRRGSVDNQDIRTVWAKRKNPASSQDDKTLVHDKIQKSSNGVT